MPVRSISFAQVATGFRISSDARDSGIQIFDKFYALILSESDSEKLSQHSARSTLVNNENVLLNCGLRKSLLEEYSEPDSQLDPNIVSYAAAVSIILGSKLHESNGELTLVSWSPQNHPNFLATFNIFDWLTTDSISNQSLLDNTHENTSNLSITSITGEFPRLRNRIAQVFRKICSREAAVQHITSSNSFRIYQKVPKSMGAWKR